MVRHAVAIGAYTFAAPEVLRRQWRLARSFLRRRLLTNRSRSQSRTARSSASPARRQGWYGCRRLRLSSTVNSRSEEKMASPSPAGSWPRTKRRVSSTSASLAASAHAWERRGTPRGNSPPFRSLRPLGVIFPLHRDRESKSHEDRRSCGSLGASCRSDTILRSRSTRASFRHSLPVLETEGGRQ